MAALLTTEHRRIILETVRRLCAAKDITVEDSPQQSYLLDTGNYFSMNVPIDKTKDIHIYFEDITLHLTPQDRELMKLLLDLADHVQDIAFVTARPSVYTHLKGEPLPQ